MNRTERIKEILRIAQLRMAEAYFDVDGSQLPAVNVAEAHASIENETIGKIEELYADILQAGQDLYAVVDAELSMVQDTNSPDDERVELLAFASSVGRAASAYGAKREEFDYQGPTVVAATKE